MAASDAPARPYILGVGGTTRPGSSTEKALALALRTLADDGCETRLFGGEFLAALPHYESEAGQRTAHELEFLSAVRRADGVILATPAYHAGISGLVKNALDLIQDTARDPRPYLDGLAVGLVVTAYGWQATGATLGSLRSIVHALRGWPTPLGVTLNTSSPAPFSSDGTCAEPRVAEQLSTMARQVASFARQTRPCGREPGG
jgi:FMN reductase